MEPILAHIFEVEGWPAYTDAPVDRGGPTKGGITLATLRAHRGRPVTVADLQALSQEEAGDIYRVRYIAPFESVEDELLRWQVVDCGVLSGTARAVRWLQEAAVVKVDGILGPKSLAAINAPGRAHALGVRLAAVRIRFLGQLIERDREQAKWTNGWMRRATSFLDREAERA
jgi:lysozyme family protein